MTVPYEELVAGYQRQQDYTRKTQALSGRASAADNWDALIEQAGDPESFASTIDAMIDLGRKAHGEDFFSERAPAKGDQSQGNPFSGINPSELTEDGKVLYEIALQSHARAVQAEKSNQELRSRVDDLVKRVEPLVQEVGEHRTLPQEAELIRQTFGVEVTPAQVADMKKRTGQTDAVAAFKVMNYDVVSKSAFMKGMNAGRKIPGAEVPPVGSSGRTYDPSDPNLTVEERIRLMQSGVMPATG